MLPPSLVWRPGQGIRRVTAEMPPEHMEETKELLLQPDIAIGGVHTNIRAQREAIPAPVVHPHNPSIAPVAERLSPSPGALGTEGSVLKAVPKLHGEIRPGGAGLFPDSPRLVPPLSSDHFARLGGVIPVAQHDAVATDLKLPGSVQRHRLPCCWILNFRLQWKKRRA